MNELSAVSHQVMTSVTTVRCPWETFANAKGERLSLR